MFKVAARCSGAFASFGRRVLAPPALHCPGVDGNDGKGGKQAALRRPPEVQRPAGKGDVLQRARKKGRAKRRGQPQQQQRPAQPGHGGGTRVPQRCRKLGGGGSATTTTTTFLRLVAFVVCHGGGCARLSRLARQALPGVDDAVGVE